MFSGWTLISEGDIESPIPSTAMPGKLRPSFEIPGWGSGRKAFPKLSGLSLGGRGVPPFRADGE